MFGMATARRTKKSRNTAALYAVPTHATTAHRDVDTMPELGEGAGLTDVTEACSYYVELLDRRLFRLRAALRGDDCTRALVATRALCGTAGNIGATDLDAVTASIEPWIRRSEFRRASAALSTISELVTDAQRQLHEQAEATA